MRRLALVAALLLGSLSFGAAPVQAQTTWCYTWDFYSYESQLGWTPDVYQGYLLANWLGNGWDDNDGAPWDAITIISPSLPSISFTSVEFRFFGFWTGGNPGVYVRNLSDQDFGTVNGESGYYVTVPVNVAGVTRFKVVADRWVGDLQRFGGGQRLRSVTLRGTGSNPFGSSNCPGEPTPTPTATATPVPTATPLLVWLPTTDYRPICTVVSDLNLTETAVAPSPFPSLVVPTMATYVLQVPTLHVPTMVLPGAPTLTPSLSPTVSETPWPTLNLPTVTPTNTRTPTPTLTCRLPDDVYPIIDVGGLVPEREPQCFRMIPLIDWDIPPINLVLFTTPEVNVHIPAVDFCVTWLPLRLSILGMDFTALLAVGLALLGARFIMGFRKEL